MPATSKAQSRFFHLVENIKKGEDHGSPKAEAAADSMSEDSISHFTDTKQKNLPEKAAKMEKEAMTMKAMEDLKGFMGKVAVRAIETRQDGRMLNIIKVAKEIMPESEPEIRSPMAFYNGYMDKAAMEGERIERYVLSHDASVPSSAIAGALLKAAGEEVINGERLRVVEDVVGHIRKVAAESGSSEKGGSSAIARWMANQNDLLATEQALNNEYMRRHGVMRTMGKNIAKPFAQIGDTITGDMPFFTATESQRDRLKKWLKDYYGHDADPTKLERSEDMAKSAAVSPMEFKNLLQSLQSGRVAGRASNASQYSSHIFQQAPEKVLAFLKTPSNTLAGHYGVEEATIEELKNAIKTSPTYKSKFGRGGQPANPTHGSTGAQTTGAPTTTPTLTTGAPTTTPTSTTGAPTTTTPPTRLMDVPTGNEAVLSNAYINEARKLDALRGQSDKLVEMAKGLRSRNKKLAYVGIPAALATGVAGTAAYNSI